MSKITAFTRGMLQFLGSLEQGHGIANLADSIQPSLDVTQFVGFNSRRFYCGTTVSPGGTLQVGGPGAVPNSATQTWIVRWFGSTIETDATGALGGAHLGFRGAGAPSVTEWMPLCVGQNMGVNSRIALTAQMERGILMGPGDQLLLCPNQIGAANHTWRWGFMYEIVSPPS